MEKEIEGPWGEEEIYLGSFLNEEKKLEVYTQTGGEEPQVYSYTQQAEDDWEKTEEVWVEERIDVDTYVNYLLRGADDNLYLMTTDIVDTGEFDQITSTDGEFVLPPQPTYLYRHTPEGETQEVMLECMDLEYQKQNGGFLPYYLGVVENGDVAVVGAATTNIVLYDGATGKKIYVAEPPDPDEQ